VEVEEVLLIMDQVELVELVVEEMVEVIQHLQQV
tara:strand:+ start:607 stop:708 length:102 start_codon:yes stop_codon:yes gene_type:complete